MTGSPRQEAATPWHRGSRRKGLGPQALPSPSPPAHGGPSPQVDVTTEDDGTPLTNSGVRACVGGTPASVLGPAAAPAGGYAYVNTFGNDYFGPALIFSGLLGGGNPRDVASVVSHEVGHTLGLVSAARRG
jgi:hypothetical protein